MSITPCDVGGRRRIAVLGGGISGLTAAYELSRTRELREQFEVTVYQMGWRLGGKLASGRNPEKSWRNEEHGLHVWFGFYENTFALADEVLKQWEAPPDCPYRRVEDIVAPHDVAMFAEELPDESGKHRFHTLHLPRTPGRPGAPNSDDPSVTLLGFTALLQTLKTIPDNLRDSFHAGTHPPEGTLLREAGTGEILIPNDLLAAVDRVVAQFSQLLVVAPDRRAKTAKRVHRACAAVQVALKPVWRAVRPGHRLRHTLYNLDVTIAVICGVCSPVFRIYEDGDLDRVQDLDFAEWLEQSGASTESIAHSAMLRCQYDAFFQFDASDRAAPRYEASTCARVYLRGLLGYRGAVAWMLQSGMGEVLIAPLYELLKARGVRFEFFHKVAHLELDQARRQLHRVHMVRQARVRKGHVYEPLVTFRGERVWLTEPDWSQLEDGAKYAKAGVNFESRWSVPALDEPVAIEHGEDFDEAILALPLGALVEQGGDAGPAADWFAAHEPARRAAAHINLQSSIAAQLWVKSPMTDFGWPAKASVVGWGHDYSIFADMTPVVAREGFDEKGAPQSSVYLCGVYPFDAVNSPSTDTDARRDADVLARELLRERLADHGEEVFGRDGHFDWDELYTHSPAKGAARLDDQYIRANVEPSDLCDGAVPGSARLRLEANESGLDNMVLASTWTRNGMNTTCVEGAVMAGMAAARALGGLAREIRAETFMSKPFSTEPVRSIRRARQLGGEMEPAFVDTLAALYGGQTPTDGALTLRRAQRGDLLEVDPDCDVAVLTGEVEVWRGERLDRFREAPWLYVAVDGETILRASEECYWVEVPIAEQHHEARIEALVGQARSAQAECDNYLRTYDDFFDEPNAQLVPGPYRFGPFNAKLLLVRTDPRRLDELLPRGFRRIPGFGGHYLVVVADLENVTSLAPGAPDASWGYRETTPLVPCMTLGSMAGAFVPELYPDAPMPVLLGRETYGFPKRIGRTQWWDNGVDVVADHRRILKGRWGEPLPADAGALAEKLAKQLVGVTPPALGRATNWAQQRALPFKLPVYVRQQFLSRDPSRRARWREDQVVQVPFTFMPVTDVAALPGASVEFADDHPVLHGELVNAWSVTTGFEFGKSKVVRAVESSRWLRGVR